MLHNMARSLILSVDADPEVEGSPKVAGRIKTTVPKAKELRPLVEKLVTLAKKSLDSSRAAEEHMTDAEKGSDAYREWRKSDGWQKWNQTIAPAVKLRRKAFSILRDNEAVDILFDDLAERFEDRPGGYLRIVRLAAVRLGDSGEQAIIEFVGDNDRTKSAPAPAPLVVNDSADASSDSESSDAAGDAEATTGDDQTDGTPDDAPETAGKETAPEAENDNEVKDD